MKFYKCKAKITIRNLETEKAIAVVYLVETMHKTESLEYVAKWCEAHPGNYVRDLQWKYEELDGDVAVEFCHTDKLKAMFG